MELLEIKNLNKSYDNKEVLKNINLNISSGKIVGLLGKNGAGKTTLIKLINDLLVPTSGEILVNGNRVGVDSKKVISYLPEKTYLNKQMKVSEVIDYFKDFYDDFDEIKAKKLLKDLDLNIDFKLSKMSKGMQEKVQLVLVMSRNADLYILDEPTTGLHTDDIKKLLVILERIVDNGDTVLIIEHNLDVIKVADYIIDLGPEGGDGGGKVIVTGTPEKVAKCTDSYTGEFLKKILK